MDTPLPAPARILGPAGLIPFAALAAAIWARIPEAGPALAAYGATILAFLGAVHWGLALRAPAAERRAEWARLGLGVTPALVAWVALLLPLSLGLGLLAIGMLLTAGVERLAAKGGWVPDEYHRLRLFLSAGAAACLVGGLAGL